MEDLPKILIISRNTWDEKKGTSSTLSNIFANYKPANLAMVYIESKLPNTTCCKSFFQIPEILMVKKLFKWQIQVGQKIDATINSKEDINTINSEEKALHFVRGHRSIIFTWLRELLWLLGFWKTKKLQSFIYDFQPDLIWIDGSTNVFLDRLALYILRKSQRPGIIYLMDDNYTYKSLTGFRFLYHTLHRKTMRKLVNRCKEILVISPKMKKEFDSIFHINSTIITKSIKYNKISKINPIHSPIRLLYMGQIIYGRNYTLEAIIDSINKINNNNTNKISLTIYTNNFIPKKLLNLSKNNQYISFKEAVSYNYVNSIIEENDILLFIESLNPKYNKDARLSFSTKITDYLASGKCIFAVGPNDCASMDYFQENDCAVIAHNQQEIEKGLLELTNEQVIRKYAIKAFETGKKNHDSLMMNSRLKKVIQNATS